MKYSVEGNSIILRECDSFCISDTLECGQCFRYERLGEEDYRLAAFGRMIRLKREHDSIVFYRVSEKDFREIWIPYFDLDRDYGKMKAYLSNADSILAEAIGFAPGIRVLRQDFFECLLTFILSQNSNIPKIKRAVENISSRYGEYIGEAEGKPYYSFPAVSSLKDVTEEDFREMKAGFRAKYLVDAVQKIANGDISLEELNKLDTAAAKEKLMTIKGVGPKVSDCVLLFSLGRAEAFPADVWVKRVMSYFYFQNKDTPLKEIQDKAKNGFGEYAGFAQQYLFHYARSLKIGV